MKQYREKMEKIQPSAGLEKTVLARARARGNASDRRIRPGKLGAVLVAAVLCVVLCIGVGASALYRWQSSVFIPGVGMTDVVVEGSEPLDDMQIWVLDEVVPLGDKQVDYVVLAPTSDGYELRVIITRGAEDTTENYSVYRQYRGENGMLVMEKNSYFGTLTAVFADGSTAEITATSAEEDNLKNYLTRLDTYVSSNFPEQTSFTLRTPQGDETAISLVEYDEKTHIVEKSNDKLSVRMFPLAKGSRYVLVDGKSTLLDERWVPSVDLVAPIDENGNKLTASMNVSIDLDLDYVAGDFETLILLKEVPQSRIVDCSLDYVLISSNYRYVVERIIPLFEPLPAEGERVSFAEPLTIFDEDGIWIQVVGMSTKDGELILYMKGNRAWENGFQVSTNRSSYLRAADGTYYDLARSTGRGEGDTWTSTDRYRRVDEEAEAKMIERLDSIYGDQYGIYLEFVSVHAAQPRYVDIPKTNQ